MGNKCIECGKETFQTVKTGVYTQSYICNSCVDKYYEIKEIQIVNTINVMVRKEVM